MYMFITTPSSTTNPVTLAPISQLYMTSTPLSLVSQSNTLEQSLLLDVTSLTLTPQNPKIPNTLSDFRRNVEYT